MISLVFFIIWIIGNVPLATKEELYDKYQSEITEYFMKKFNGWIKDAAKHK